MQIEITAMCHNDSPDNLLGAEHDDAPWYEFTNTVDGEPVHYGAFPGATEAVALDALASFNGYADYAEACRDGAHKEGSGIEVVQI